MASNGHDEPGYRAMYEESKLDMQTPQNWLQGYELDERKKLYQLKRLSNISTAYGIAPTTFGRGGEVCTDCLSWTASVAYRQLQPDFKPFYFPFDSQTISLSIRIPQTHIYGCHGGADSPLLRAMDMAHEGPGSFDATDLAAYLLPPTGEFFFNGDPSTAITIRHMTKGQGAQKVEDYQSCEIIFNVRRNFQVFFVRSILTTIIVIGGSIATALLMHPGEHTGDREAVLFIAFLISVTNIQTTETGMGKVTSMLWIDIFNIVQLLLSLVAVIQTIIVHYLITTNRDAVAVHLDNACKVTLPVLYVGLTGAMFLIATSEFDQVKYDTAVALIATLSTCAIPATLFLAWLRATKFDRDRRRSVAVLRTVGIHGGKRSEDAITQFFNCFDLDSNGTLDKDELRALLEYLNPGATSKDLSTSMQFLRSYEDTTSGELNAKDFTDALRDLEAAQIYKMALLEGGCALSDASALEAAMPLPKARMNVLRGRLHFARIPIGARNPKTASKMTSAAAAPAVENLDAVADAVLAATAPLSSLSKSSGSCLKGIFSPTSRRLSRVTTPKQRSE